MKAEAVKPKRGTPEYYKLYRKLNPEKEKAKKQKYNASHPEKLKEWEWKRSGIHITHEDYEGLLAAQDYRCAICGTHASDLNKALAVDHDHNTGKIRGLLCSACNVGIGNLKDKSEIAAAAFRYLRLHELQP
jgi:hypothetical protein